MPPNKPDKPRLTALPFKPSKGGVTIEVKVKPRSSRASIEGIEAGKLLVKLTAPPAGGEANAQLAEVLSDALGIPKSLIKIIRGGRSRTKLVEIAMDASTLAERLSG